MNASMVISGYLGASCLHARTAKSESARSHLYCDGD